MPTKIEWADEVWNPVTGCTPISEGCKNCYAKRMAQRLKGRAGYPPDDPFRVTYHPDKLDQPLRWKNPRKVFVCSMGDLFHEDVRDYDLLKIWSQMCVCGSFPGAPKHTFMILTKRPKRMAEWVFSFFGDEYNNPRPVPSHIWLGISASNQPDLDRWIPTLLKIPAAKRFVSYEPALGPVDFKYLLEKPDPNQPCPDCNQEGCEKCGNVGYRFNSLDLIIAGGESGPGARPSHPDWFRRVRDDCDAAGIPFNFKQWGEWMSFRPSAYGYYVAAAGDSWAWKKHWRMLTMFDERHPCPEWLNSPYDRDNLSLWGNVARVGKKAAGRELDGVIHDGWPGE